MQEAGAPFLPKPRKRSPLRLWAGKQWYVFRRKLRWWFSGTRFARRQATAPLPHLVFTHATPTLRQLKNVDMWMQHNKVKNLEIAIRRLNGLVIAPGDTFSYWRRIGKPTRAKGYVPGMQLVQGKVTTATGGGLCQLSNLIFWMAMHAPLQIVERWRHSYDVFPDAGRSQPFGSGATCAYNYIDLQLRNDTAHALQLRLWIEDDMLHGELRSDAPPTARYEVFEADHRFKVQPWGYTRHNRIHRRVIDAASGEVMGEEPLIENHAICMYNPSLPENSASAQ